VRRGRCELRRGARTHGPPVKIQHEFCGLFHCGDGVPAPRLKRRSVCAESLPELIQSRVPATDRLLAQQVLDDHLIQGLIIQVVDQGLGTPLVEGAGLLH
jgi:hypothetical protein